MGLTFKLGTAPQVTTNYIPKSSSNSFSNSLLYDDGTNVGIGTASPSSILTISQSNSAASTSLTIINASNASNTTKTAQVLYRLADTAGTLKDAGYIKSTPEGVNVLDAGLAFGTRNSDTTSDKMFLSSSGVLSFGGANTVQSTDKPHLFRISGGGLGISANNEGSGNQPINFYTSGALRATITSTGNVGIGTSSPSAILHTSVTTNGTSIGALFANPNQAGTADAVSINFGLGRTTDAFLFSIPAIKFGKEQQWTSTGSTVDGYLAFSTMLNETVTERMRITSDGRFWVRTDASLSPGGVSGISNMRNPDNNGLWALALQNDATTESYGRGIGIRFATDFNTSSNEFIFCVGNTTPRFYVQSNGYVYARSTSITLISSDRNLKTNIKDYDKGLAEVLAMKPRYYNFKDNLEKQEIGFIAQEMDEALPGSMIDGRKDDVTGEIHKTYQIEWYPLLVKAMQEQNQLISELSAKVSALEAKA